jgi:hypothetical protein
VQNLKPTMAIPSGKMPPLLSYVLCIPNKLSDITHRWQLQGRRSRLHVTNPALTISRKQINATILHKTYNGHMAYSSSIVEYYCNRMI